MEKELLDPLIGNVANKHISERIKLLNVFTFPQAFWIIELYYLMLNSFFDIIIKIPGGEKLVNFVPNPINKYNDLIFKYFNEWSLFVILLSLGLLLSGIIISIVAHLPVVSNYTIIKRYSSYGISTFFWFFLIGVTYELYIWTKFLFSLFSFVLFALIVGYIEIETTIKKKAQFLC